MVVIHPKILQNLYIKIIFYLIYIYYFINTYLKLFNFDLNKYVKPIIS